MLTLIQGFLIYLFGYFASSDLAKTFEEDGKNVKGWRGRKQTMHMKKIIALALSAALLLSMAACAGPEAQSTEPEVITAEVRAKLDTIAQEKNYRGIVYLTHNGKTVYEYVSGVNDMGKPLTVDIQAVLRCRRSDATGSGQAEPG